VTVTKTQRFGIAYASKPWCVVVRVGNQKTTHRFKTETDADTFIAGL